MRPAASAQHHLMSSSWPQAYPILGAFCFAPASNDSMHLTDPCGDTCAWASCCGTCGLARGRGCVLRVIAWAWVQNQNQNQNQNQSPPANTIIRTPGAFAGHGRSEGRRKAAGPSRFRSSKVATLEAPSAWRRVGYQRALGLPMVRQATDPARAACSVHLQLPATEATWDSWHRREVGIRLVEGRHRGEGSGGMGSGGMLPLEADREGCSESG